MSIQQMPLAEFAELEASFGVKIVRRGGIFWRQVRPFFYRPLLPSEPPSDGAGASAPGRWCAYQHVVADNDGANSTLNFLLYENTAGYSLDALGHSRRKQTKKAARTFTVRRIRDAREFQQDAFGVYQSFYERTRYPYLRERVRRASFDRWADRVLRHPASIVLGGYGPDGLGAVGIAYWVSHTLIYASLFSETRAMKKDVVSVLLHELRLLAAGQPGIREILASAYRGADDSLNRFYIERGCSLVRKPARLCVHPLVLALLQRFAPRTYNTLLGSG